MRREASLYLTFLLGAHEFCVFCLYVATHCGAQGRKLAQDAMEGSQAQTVCPPCVDICLSVSHDLLQRPFWSAIETFASIESVACCPARVFIRELAVMLHV